MLGQQETVTVAGSSSTLRRTILALLVAALMAATMVASASPAIAENLKGPDGKRPIASGDIFGPQHNGASVFHSGSGADVFVHGNAGGDGETGH